MRFFKFKSWTSAIAALLITGGIAWAANTALSSLSASGAISASNLLYVVQTPGSGGVKATFTQVATFINSLFSGDFTCTSGGACTLKSAGPGATGPIGSTTTAPSVTIDAQGRVTGLTSNNIAFPAAPAGANPSATAGPTANNGSATTFMRSDASPAVQQGSASQKGIVQVDGTTITATGGVISATGTGSGVTSVSAGCGLSTGGSPITTTGTVSANAPINPQTGTSYTLLSTDCGKVVTLKNASAVAVTIPVATTSGFGSPFYTTFINEGAGLVTLTPTTSTIDGAASLTLAQGQSVDLITDGTNYFTLRGRPTMACAGLTGGATCGTPVGTIVGTVTTQSSTTYTFAASDCGTTVRFTNASAVTATIPQGLPIGCVIAVLQAAAGQVAVNGSAVTPATLQSAHSYTKTFGAGAVINLTNDTTNHVILSGDGA